jgi:hypothetical protein
MTSTAATRISHDQQPGRNDMDEHQRGEYLRIAYRAADQEWRAVNEAAHSPSPEDLAAAYERARDAALAALAGAGLDGDEALADRAAPQQDDESEVPARYAEHHVSRYPAQVGSISWHLLADGEPPRVFRTGNPVAIYAAACISSSSSMTSCGVL